MYKIDAHSHFHDPFIEQGMSRIFKENGVVEKMSGGAHSKKAFESPEERLRSMDRGGVAAAIIQYQMIWQKYDEEKYPASLRVTLSKFANDRLAEVSQRYSGRFFMLADLPLMDVNASIAEAKRCQKMGAKGICVHTNVNGKPLTSPEFQPLWAEVDRLGLAMFVHPRSYIVTQRISTTHKFPNMLDYAFETTMAAVDFLMDGFFEKYKRINVMLSHCGGALPFLQKRLDIPAIYGSPSMSNMLDRFYYDTGVSFTRQVQFTIDIVGLDRVCYGSDYPYWDFRETSGVVEALHLEAYEKGKIFSGNALKFLGIAGN